MFVADNVIFIEVYDFVQYTALVYNFTIRALYEHIKQRKYIYRLL